MSTPSPPTGVHIPAPQHKRPLSCLSPSLRVGGAAHTVQKRSQGNRRGVIEPLQCGADQRIVVYGARGQSDALHDLGCDDGAGALPPGARGQDAGAADPSRTKGVAQHLLKRAKDLVASGAGNNANISGIVHVPNKELLPSVGSSLVNRDSRRTETTGCDGQDASPGAANGATVVVPLKHSIVTATTDRVARSPLAIEGASYGVQPRRTTSCHRMKAHRALFRFLCLARSRLTRLDSLSRAFAHGVAGEIVTPPRRQIPVTFQNSDRLAYLEIAQRAQVELVNGYTVLCLGLQSFLAAKRISC